ncbi:hypothetical protein B296_00057283 [Ensete ventricosum]|uniref:Peptidase C1A papain C-terminal domain-containing protein n=1 Tax=Ensete ventricosum TaxID=4639 RepID=A0A426WWH8_ENSVE|nr:hypothetical protein B296_00057283 [Ensete ventricosum]
MNAVANQPVSVAIDSHEIQFSSGGIYDGPCGTNLNHEVTLVGYGTDADGTAYWIAENSWGTAWGESGYILLAKDVAEKGRTVRRSQATPNHASRPSRAVRPRALDSLKPRQRRLGLTWFRRPV